MIPRLPSNGGIAGSPNLVGCKNIYIRTELFYNLWLSGQKSKQKKVTWDVQTRGRESASGTGSAVNWPASLVRQTGTGVPVQKLVLVPPKLVPGQCQITILHWPGMTSSRLSIELALGQHDVDHSASLRPGCAIKTAASALVRQYPNQPTSFH